jgi:TRAP-type C4-dicarboxylate transport system substrate-binding protein
MNLDAWNGASPELQKILLDEGEKIEVQWFNDFERMKSEDEATLKAAGVLLTEMPADKASGLRSAFMDGIWKAAEAQDPADAASIRSLAKQHGLTE